MICRANYAAALVDGELSSRPAAFDVLSLARRHGAEVSLKGILAFYSRLLTGAAPGSAWQERLDAALGKPADMTPAIARRALALLLASPEAQVA